MQPRALLPPQPYQIASVRREQKLTALPSSTDKKYSGIYHWASTAAIHFAVAAAAMFSNDKSPSFFASASNAFSHSIAD
jgi:hypothetical protein